MVYPGAPGTEQGLDNNCDGRIDEGNPGGTCTCFKSYTRSVSTSYIDKKRNYNKTNIPVSDIKMYTYLTQFDESGSCPLSGTGQKRVDEIYAQVCRTRTNEALICSGDPQNPPGNAWSVYCARCCGMGDNSCSYGAVHPCSSGNRPWEKSGDDDTPQQCFDKCKNWCSGAQFQAASCRMPKGDLKRFAMATDPNDGKLVPKETMSFGDVLNKQADTNQRALYVNFDDPNMTTNDARAGHKGILPKSFDTNGMPVFEAPPASSILVDHRNVGNGLFTPDKPTVPQANVNTTHAFEENNATQGLIKGMRLSCTYEQCQSTCKGPYCCTPEECHDCNTSGCTSGCVGDDCVLERKQIVGLIRGQSATPTTTRCIDANNNETSVQRTRCSVLGAVYHSSPALLSPPFSVSEDPKFNEWVKNTPGIANRPNVIFTGSNDGVMHAFHAESGIELWGFIPKTILPKLKTVAQGARPNGGRIYTTDGSPVISNALQMFRYAQEQNGIKRVIARYRSVLLFGLGAGGRGYVAIDVSDPLHPQLMWEINHHSLKDPLDPTKGTFDRMGYTVARPAIANVVINWNPADRKPDPNASPMERAVAILPGGADLHHLNYPPFHKLNKGENKIGAVIYIVDLETGMMLAEIHPYDLTGGARPSSLGVPLDGAYKPISACQARGVTGTPSVYPVAPQVATRFFVGDMLGRVFRINISSPNHQDWSNLTPGGLPKIANVQKETIRLVHNLYEYDTHSQPFMNHMAIALNPRGELIIAGGTGNVLNMESYHSPSKIFSIREILNNNGQFAYGVHNYKANLDKYVEEDPVSKKMVQRQAASYTGEKVTGDPLIVNNTLYFASLDISHGMPPICGIPGEARIYGLRYEQGCTTGNCSGSGKVASKHDPKRTPLFCCEPGGCGLSKTFADTEMRTHDKNAVCNDLNYTEPALVTDPPSTNAQQYEYIRFHGYGPNTMSMGPTVAYTPGEIETVNRVNPQDP
ncbi:MAG: PilC/PilY family type IV pilus protein, partial [Myxococcota bacterium]